MMMLRLSNVRSWSIVKPSHSLHYATKQLLIPSIHRSSYQSKNLFNHFCTTKNQNIDLQPKEQAKILFELASKESNLTIQSIEWIEDRCEITVIKPLVGNNTTSDLEFESPDIDDLTQMNHILNEKIEANPTVNQLFHTYEVNHTFLHILS